MNMLQLFKSARRVSTPLIAITTPDPAATIESIVAIMKNGKKEAPCMRWDIINGLVPLNNPGQDALQTILPPDVDPVSASGNPAEALALCAKLPTRSLVFMMNAHRFIQNEAVAQAIWNLRDSYKRENKTLVMLAPGIVLPAELSQDVLVLDESLPGDKELEKIVVDLHEAAEIAAPGSDILKASVDALRGLAAFPAEQVTAMALTKEGVQIDNLWERKRKMIENTEGLSVWRGGETFEDVQGATNVTDFLMQVLAGRRSPRCVVFLDEIEKMLSGATGPVGDSSGVSQAMLGTLLTYMQDNDVAGVIFVGPPGCLGANTPLSLRRGKRHSGRTYTIKDAYRLFLGGKNRSRYWNLDISTNIQCLEDGVIVYRPIKAIVKTGRQQTFTVKIEGCEPFRVTANHKFKVPASTPNADSEGFVRLSALKPGRLVVTRTVEMSAGGKTSFKRRRTVHGMKFHPYAWKMNRYWRANPSGKDYGRIPCAKAVIEADLNGLSLVNFVEVCRKDQTAAKRLKYLPKDIVVHHIDGDPLNDEFSNLSVMTKLEHDALHGKANSKNFGNVSARTARVEWITPYGEEDTYDVQMYGPSHNFLVNGVVVHNSGKSMVGKATGNTAGIPTIYFDLGSMKGSLVGESEMRLRSSLKVVTAVSGGDALFIATCNRIAILPPELRRRFGFGTFFFDLPNKDERKKIWNYYLGKFECEKQVLPNDAGWTGAEIKRCCELAWRLKRSLLDVSSFIVPVSQSAYEDIKNLRTEAHGRFVSASYPGVYKQSVEMTQASDAQRRKLDLN